MTTAAISAPRSKTIIIWVLRGLMAALFLFASFMKLTGKPDMVAEFDTIGFGQGLRYLTGLMELAGGIGILVPPVSIFGALLLLTVDAGAFIAQVTVLHMDWIHTVVIGALLVAAIFLQRPQLRKR